MSLDGRRWATSSANISGLTFSQTGDKHRAGVTAASHRSDSRSHDRSATDRRGSGGPGHPKRGSNKLATVPYATLQRSDRIAILKVDRPPANAMSLELLQEIVAALRGIERDLPGALVLSGREGFFSAGVDLKALPGYRPAEQRRMVQAINEMALTTYALPCPVVGAITGHAIAGGLVLALCSDVRVASTNGSYGLTEVKVGVAYPQVAIGLVRAELAPNAARVLALGNALVDAGECMRLGVFDEVLEPTAVLPRAIELAGGLAGFPADTYARTKHELRAATIARLRRSAAEDPLLASWVA
jgi:enoyl-CoA hydratase